MQQFVILCITCSVEKVAIEDASNTLWCVHGADDQYGCLWCRLSDAKFQDTDDLLTNPSLGTGISELTAALRQQRPRRDITTLPPVQSDPSLHDAASTGASSSPGMTSPFAALAHSPQDSYGATLAGPSTASAEDAPQTFAQPIPLGGPEPGIMNHQQPSPFGSEQSMPSSTGCPSEQQHDLQHQQQQQADGMVPDACEAHGEDETDVMSASSSDSRQSFRRKGRPRCAVM